MKYFSIIVLTVLSFFVRAQDTTFNILNHSYPSTNSFYAMDKLGDSYFLFMAQMDTPNYYQHVNYGILKLNSGFQIVDSVMIDIDKTVVAINGSGFNVSPMDTSIVFCGVIKYENGQKQFGYIAKFNKELDTLWTKQIMHPDTAYADTAQTPWVVLRDVKITPEGNYLIVGNYNYHCQGNTDRNFIINMDTSGNILWYKFLDPNIYQSYITNIEIDPLDSGFYIASFIYNAMQLIKFDKNGNYIWKTPYNNYPSLSWVSDIEVVGNQIIIGSNYFIPPWVPYEQESKLYIVSVDRQTQSINWDREFTSISVVSIYLRQEVIKVKEMPNGNIAVGSVGMKYKDSIFYYDFRANILMLNSNGDSLWSHYYTYQNDSTGLEDMQFNDMVVCDDDGILMGGSYYSYPNDPQFIRAWLVKTDSIGNAPGMFTVGIEEHELVIKNYQLKVYPNPTSDIVNLSVEETPKKDLHLEVYNIQGQLVMQQRLPEFEKEQRVDVRHLQSGVYLIRLLSENQVVYSSKIIKE